MCAGDRCDSLTVFFALLMSDCGCISGIVRFLTGVIVGIRTVACAAARELRFRTEQGTVLSGVKMTLFMCFAVLLAEFAA